MAMTPTSVRLRGLSNATFLRPMAPNHLVSSLASKGKKHCRIICASVPPDRRDSRRSVSIALFLSQWLSIPKHASAGSILDKYVKRKKLDPLEAYVPPVILTQLQIKDLEKALESNKPEYATCRSLLRSGPVASLRVNIRAVAQYASDGGNGKAAYDDVDQCLRALEELDSLLLRATRNDPGASVEAMKVKISIALGAMDSLLQTVPPAVLDKGKAIADAYKMPVKDLEPESLDPEMKQLESIL
ncbi:PREDICTED: uncharacterized protein LOC104600569 [Nelumbo nucifera]|uniref:Uncharacterized protein LOC104600569 n=2 Tax=Nelumbo nucifera TaxID=4432 RepID=A0A1U8A443_NELNU|nr:PREDICTED: uncharacterized protein LOC104600569 [Nelumbo nucifera]DAD44266.1 TPA_asm: hypothetical protein HUJ06_002496 [Nelumbo nucifera]